MLTPALVSTVDASPTVIALRGLAGNTVWYTVPAGKKFIGSFINNGNMELKINSVLIFTTSTTNQPPHPIDVVLPEGTVVSCGPSYVSWSIVGTEISNGTTLDQI